MSREIKFRAWTQQSFLYRTLFDRNWYNSGDKLVREALPTDNHFFIVEQYTGLNDKNGVEIYEGDIVADGYHDKYGRYAIQWSDKYHRWSFISTDGRELEVIGNIHENKELLI